MKKMMLLAAAAVLALQAVPAFAEDGAKHKRGDRGNKYFDMVDANKDGVVSAEENAAFSKKKFDEMDGNKDGKVTKEEAHAHHAAKKAKWEEMKAKKKAEKAVEAPAGQ